MICEIIPQRFKIPSYITLYYHNTVITLPTQVKVIGEEDDVDYNTDEAKASVICDVTRNDVTSHVCPAELSELTEQDFVIWVRNSFTELL